MAILLSVIGFFSNCLDVKQRQDLFHNKFEKYVWNSTGKKVSFKKPIRINDWGGVDLLTYSMRPINIWHPLKSSIKIVNPPKNCRPDFYRKKLHTPSNPPAPDHGWCKINNEHSLNCIYFWNGRSIIQCSWKLFTVIWNITLQ